MAPKTAINPKLAEIVRRIMQDPASAICPACEEVGFWDNRTNKKNPKGPDFKCKNKECKGAKPLQDPQPYAVWIPEAWTDAPAAKANGTPAAKPVTHSPSSGPYVPGLDDAPPPDDKDAPGADLQAAAAEAIDERDARAVKLEATFNAIWQRQAVQQAAVSQDGKTFPYDAASVNSAAAAIFIALDKQGLLR